MLRAMMHVQYYVIRRRARRYTTMVDQSNQNEHTTCKILFSDDDLCIVSKPPGLFVHRSTLDRKLPDCRTILEAKFGQSLYNIHRIDRPASGLVLFALTKKAASGLSAQFRERVVEKRYLAIVRGHVPDEIRIEYPLSTYRSERPAAAASLVKCIAHSIIYEPVGIYQEGWFSLVEIMLETGRPHQARRHLKHIGHPIIGDTQYGDRLQNRFAKSKFGFLRLCLRAYGMVFSHPTLQKKVDCCAGLPPWWLEMLNGLALRMPAEISVTARVIQNL